MRRAVAVSTTIVRRLLEAADLLDEYRRLQPRIARCMTHPPGWQADPEAAARLADDLRRLAGSYAGREEQRSLARGARSG